MKNKKDQGSKEKKSRPKKDFSKNNKKITDFFNKNNSGTNSNNTDDIIVNYIKNENNINIKEEIEEDNNIINISDDENSNLIFDEYFYNNNKNSNIKNLKKKMVDNNAINSIEVKSIQRNIFPPWCFINLNTQSISDEKRNLILMHIKDDNNINLQKLEVKQDNFDNIKDYHKSFPFQNSRILNINNSSYIIGGKLNDKISRTKYNNDLGVTNCYKIIYIKDKKDNPQIKIIKFPSTIFEHQSHSLLYLKKFNIIVLCSGHKQKKCEYLLLQNNGKENKWEQLHSLRKPRENALPLLFNEKYIFLVGGSDLNGNINLDYDVLNYELYNTSKYQCFWKTYSFKNDYLNILLKQKGSGIIYNKDNNIYIIGGYNIEKEFNSWKIQFEEDKKEEESMFISNGDKIYKISSVVSCGNINNYINQYNNKNSYSFCGDQVFMNYKDYYVNISFGGQMTILHSSLFN